MTQPNCIAVPALTSLLLLAGCPLPGSSTDDAGSSGATEGTEGTEGTGEFTEPTGDATDTGGSDDGVDDTGDPPGEIEGFELLVLAEDSVGLFSGQIESEQTRLVAVDIDSEGMTVGEPVDVAGSTIRGYGFGDGPDSRPSESPAGDRIAWISAEDGGLHVRSADLSDDAMALTPGAAYVSRYWWNPQGTWLAALDGTTVLLVAADGSASQSFETFEIFGDEQPRWSADGRTFAHASFGARIVTTDGADYALPGSSVALSADGSRIAYGESNDVYVADVDGSNAILVDDSAGDVQSAPDGSYFVYGSFGSLAMSDFDGTAPEVIGQFGVSGRYWFSSDSRYVAYVVDQLADLWLADTQGPGDDLLYDGEDAITGVQWRPDGQQLSFVGDDETLYIAEPNGPVVPASTEVPVVSSEWIGDWVLWASETGAELSRTLAAAGPANGPEHGAPPSLPGGSVETGELMQQIAESLQPGEFIVRGRTELEYRQIADEWIVIAWVMLVEVVDGSTVAPRLVRYWRRVDKLDVEYDYFVFEDGSDWVIDNGLSMNTYIDLVKRAAQSGQ